MKQSVIAVIAAAIAALWPARAAAAPAVQASTQAATSVADLYRGERLRDPFSKPGGGDGASVAEEAEVFSIHALQLKGVMKDRAGDCAVLVTPGGATYILKRGRLVDPRNKPVPGVTGKVFPLQKKVLLQTPDKDVQVFILGEDEEGKEGT